MEIGNPVACRAVWISDLHLGTKGCQAAMLLEFLQHISTPTLYLVGDILDGWRLRKKWFWPQAHNAVIQHILQLAANGTNITIIAGNHDEGLRDFLGLAFGNIKVLDETIHTLHDGRRFLVIHGDQFDMVVTNAKWLAYLGDHAYRTILVWNNFFNKILRRLGLSHWSLTSYLKNKVKVIDRFERTLAAEAERLGLDGVVCGHIHKAKIRDINGITYCNDGDWVESCTALIEDQDGQLQLIDWPKQRKHAAALS
ncbi:MAG: UDP-2,3-diacylglucosamine diphosphatase [Alphaproteobacteria bacterium]